VTLRGNKKRRTHHLRALFRVNHFIFMSAGIDVDEQGVVVLRDPNPCPVFAVWTGRPVVARFW
jgi:hypothetical protein